MTAEPGGLRWTDAAGRTVEYVVMVMGSGYDRGAARYVPLPFDGPQFRVSDTAPRFVRGYARTEAGLLALGVDAATVAAITETIERLAAEA